MTITGGSALSKDDIDKMIRDAEQYAEEDRQRREAVETRNQADGARLHRPRSSSAENADKIPADVKSEVEADVASLKTALEGEDTDAIKAAATKLGDVEPEDGCGDVRQRRRRRGRRAARAGRSHRRPTTTTSSTPRSSTKARPRKRRRSDARRRDHDREPGDEGPVIRDKRRIDP